MDVQGAELDILKGASETLVNCKDLILELQEGEYNTGSIGFTGSSGFIGSASSVAGPAGFVGSRGFDGPASTVPGFTGSASTVAGFVGSRGVTGFVGSKGDGLVNSGSTSYAAYYSGATTISSAVGTAIYAGDFVIASDQNLKNVIGKIDNALDIIKTIDGYRYTWNSVAQDLGYDNGKVEIGVLAQQVEKHLPELIYADSDNGHKLVAYSRIVAVLIEAVKELSAKVDALENK